MIAITAILFVWFWVSCFIFKYLSNRNLELEKSVKKLNDLNNNLSQESLYHERMYKEMLDINFKLVKK